MDNKYPTASPGDGVDLDFRRAMVDFKQMFPNVDVNVIERALRENHGSVGATIDQLLAVNACGEATTRPSASAAPGPSPMSFLENLPPPPSYSEALATSPETAVKQYTPPYSPDLRGFRSYPGTPGRQKLYDPPLVGDLPENFLRLSLGHDMSDFNPPHQNMSNSLGQADDPQKRTDNLAELHSRQQSAETPVFPTHTEYNDWGQARSDRCRRSAGAYQRNSSYEPRARLGIFGGTYGYQGGRVSLSQNVARRQERQSKQIVESINRQSRDIQDQLVDNEWNRALSTDPEVVKFLEDERIALMLQNKEFVEHLSRHPGFESYAAGARHGSSSRSSTTTSHQSSSSSSTAKSALEKTKKRFDRLRRHTTDSSVFGRSSGGQNGLPPDDMPADPFPFTVEFTKEDEEPALKDRVKAMNKVSKQRLALMYRRFTKKQRGAKGILGTSDAHYSGASLLDSTDDPASELLPSERDFGKETGYDQPSSDEESEEPGSYRKNVVLR